ncbi:MAG: hypothetical protein BGO67_09840 [Alphaproteobacteria bacterium 41-28]|nr:MAG: hypothetical protein BGO67_09840 [Alphaproteobacteria bacterium 41-28]
MLTMIEPKDHGLYKHTIQSYLNLLKIYQSCDLFLKEKERTTFIIVEDEIRGVYGGAALCKQPVSSLSERVAKVILSFQPERQDIWYGRVCFCVEDDESIFTLSILDFYQKFYLNLYQAFVEFGKKKNLDFLALTLRFKDYRNSKIYGYWPYLLEAEDTPDNHLHGLLDVNSSNALKIIQALSLSSTNRLVQ